MKTEKCVNCSCDTGIEITKNINERQYYIEGAGQLCRSCYESVYTSKETQHKHLIELLKIRDYNITRLEYFPMTKRYAVTIEVKIGKSIKILHANECSLLEVAISLEDAYFEVIRQSTEKSFIRELEKHYIL